MQLRNYITIAALSLAFGAATPLDLSAQPDTELAVIVHRQHPASTISEGELKALFSRRRSSWEGRTVAPFNLQPSSRARTTFDQAVLDLGPDSVARFWINARIRSGKRPPRTIPTAALMVRAVARVPTAIGYVPSAMVNDSVKVIARIRGGEVIPE